MFPTIIQLRLYVFAGELFSAHIGENCHFFLTHYLLNLSAWLEHQNICLLKKQKQLFRTPYCAQRACISVESYVCAFARCVQGGHGVGGSGRGVGGGGGNNLLVCRACSSQLLDTSEQASSLALLHQETMACTILDGLSFMGLRLKLCLQKAS